ncbi:MAG: tRNA pseudouridine(55) synthase TruB, partial [Clostridiales bacterium]|nr:tRNA pseudouridine(55) synthase TruB [Clostridiales bacterium]
MINGIINVYKEPGYTSHDVVAKLRGILRQKKIGHTGTLDPQAKGVLPVCLGNATKVSGLLTDRSKSYQVVGLLGTVTDTQDIHGKVIESKRVDIKKYDLIQTIKSFVGEYNQIPPMYSAIKIDGKKLYDYARQGKEVERKPRKVFIDSIEILDINMDAGEFKLLVDCSKGTYIRTLVHDIGQKLACGACMKDLLRTRVGEFNLSSSKTLSQIEEHFT